MFKLTRNLITFLLVTLFLASCSTVEEQQGKAVKSDELVVLVHGLGRSGLAMWRLSQRIESAGYPVCVLDYDSIGETWYQVMEETTNQINHCVEDVERVHFVGHSLGGLVVRAYLHGQPSSMESPKLGEVVLIGTPNKGSEVADYYKDHFLMKYAGETSQSLMTGEDTLGFQLPEPYFKPGVIAGTRTMWMTDHMFEGPNDGLVSVESTKLNSMKDFVAIEVGHSSMRYNEEVAMQTIHFLERGQFKH